MNIGPRRRRRAALRARGFPDADQALAAAGRGRPARADPDRGKDPSLPRAAGGGSRADRRFAPRRRREIRARAGWLGGAERDLVVRAPASA